MAKEVEIKDNTLSLRIDGASEDGGNRNDYVEIGGDLAKRRVDLGGGLGLSGQIPFGNDITVIGSTGITVKVLSNAGISGSKAQEQHDGSHDMPLGPGAMGAFEMRDILNEVVARTGGNLGNLTIAGMDALLMEHPKLVQPDVLNDIQSTIAKLQKPYGIPLADINQAQQAINILYKSAQAENTLGATITNVNSELAKIAPGIQLSPGAEAVLQSAFNKAGENNSNGVNISELYAASQKLLPILSQSYVPADYVLPLTLSKLDNMAQKAQDYIASNGGAPDVSNSITTAVNGVLAQDNLTQLDNIVQNFIASSGGQPAVSNIISNAINGVPAKDSLAHPLTPENVSQIQNSVANINNYAGTITSTYRSLPSDQEIRHYQHLANLAVSLDPQVEAKAFGAVAVLTPYVNAAAVAERGASLGIGDVDYVAGTGVRVHPGMTQSVRVEIGRGRDSFSFSPETAQQLNQPFPHQVPRQETPQVSTYAFVKQEADSWMTISGSRKTNEAGVGVKLAESLGKTEAIVSVEGGITHTGSTIPGDTPKNHEAVAKIQGIIKF